MAAVRVLADEHIKFSVLTVKPADPGNPTDTELNAGIDASCLVLAGDFTWSAADSERIGERKLCEATAAETPGIGNYSLGFTAWRWYDPTTGEIDPVADVLFEAVKRKGTELWGYARRTGKLHSMPWVSTDEIQLGGAFVVDTPQVPDNGSGFIKYRIPCLPQAMHDFVAAAAGTPPPAWAATTAYALGDFVTLTGGATLEATTAGTSGSTEPAPPASVGGTVTDGTVTWTRRS